MLSRNSYPALVLNADGRPMSVFPFLLSDWQKSIMDVRAEKVIVLAEYERVVRSPGGVYEPQAIRIPSVIANVDYQRQDRPAPFNRIGVFVRDRGRCAYCQCSLSRKELTFDHVIPRSKGGRNTYDNVVASCGPCNSRKANKSLGQSGMRLHVDPYVPTRMQMNEMALRNFPPQAGRVHETWWQFLGIQGRDEAALVSDEQVSEEVFPKGMTSEDYWTVEITN